MRKLNKRFTEAGIAYQQVCRRGKVAMYGLYKEGKCIGYQVFDILVIPAWGDNKAREVYNYRAMVVQWGRALDILGKKVGPFLAGYLTRFHKIVQ